MSLVTTDMLNLAYETEQIAYRLGAEDLREAILTLYKAISNGMSPGDMRDLFNTIYVQNVIEGNTGIDIITKVKNWKKEKEEKQQEPTCRFKVGDEIKCIEPLSINYGMRYVVLRTGDEMKLLDPNTFAVHYSDNFGYFNKTGKHYDSIPIPKGENE